MSNRAAITEGTEDSKSEKAGKYLTFVLDSEEYGIGVMKVKEIIGMIPVTSVPRMPDYVLIVRTTRLASNLSVMKKLPMT